MPGGLPAGGYNPAFFERLIQAEDRHFWFRHRNKVIQSVLQPLVADLEAGYRVLEVGCGTGNTLRILEDTCTRGTVIGMDLYDEGLRIARRRVRCQLVQGDIEDIPIPGDFEVIGAFDVLEHLRDDVEILSVLRQRLRRGGRLLLTVPAHMTLWSYADEAARHCRRYAPEQLRLVLRDAGYAVEYLTQFMSVIYPLVWVGRRVAAQRAGGAAGEQAFELLSRELRIVPVWNGLLASLLATELPHLRARKTLPLGTSLLAIAVRDT